MGIVEIAAAITIWGMFGCFLIFPHCGLPAVFHRTAMALLAAELLALMVWSYGGEAARPRRSTSRCSRSRSSSSRCCSAFA
jgi:hypothetical protein